MVTVSLRDHLRLQESAVPILIEVSLALQLIYDTKLNFRNAQLAFDNMLWSDRPHYFSERIR